MEILLCGIVAFFSLGYLIEKATAFIKQLKTSNPTKFGKGFEAKLSVVPIQQKSEVSVKDTNSTNDLDE